MRGQGEWAQIGAGPWAGDQAGGWGVSPEVLGLQILLSGQGSQADPVREERGRL